MQSAEMRNRFSLRNYIVCDNFKDPSRQCLLFNLFCYVMLIMAEKNSWPNSHIPADRKTRNFSSIV